MPRSAASAAVGPKFEADGQLRDRSCEKLVKFTWPSLNCRGNSCISRHFAMIFLDYLRFTLRIRLSHPPRHCWVLFFRRLTICRLTAGGRMAASSGTAGGMHPAAKGPEARPLREKPRLTPWDFAFASHWPLTFWSFNIFLIMHFTSCQSNNVQHTDSWPLGRSTHSLHLVNLGVKNNFKHDLDMGAPRSNKIIEFRGSTCFNNIFHDHLKISQAHLTSQILQTI